MKTCKHEVDVERYFDGDPSAPDWIADHVAECPACHTHMAALEAIRQGAGAITGEAAIEDGQFHAFMDGIRSELDTPGRRWGGLWAVTSLVAASLVVALSTFAIFSGSVDTVEAKTEVEYATTEMEGATTTVEYSEDGTATVWVDVPEGDMW